MDLQGKKALVTGASRGIGRATALLLAQEGADIAINYVSNEQAAQDVAKRIEALGRRTLTLQGDVGDPDQVEAMFAVIGERWGGVDVLVNNAGGRCDGTVLETDESDWERTLGVHVLGTVRCCRLALPAMIEKRQGVIVNISSTAGLRGVRRMAAYATAKAAVAHLTRCLAVEASDHNVRVNCVAPGITETDFHAVTPPEFLKHSVDNRIPLHRIGKPEEVAQAVAFLVKNDYVTGEVVTVDGGLTMRIA
jgi:NAD(P)-dependent dehydrogenase (short-subunit alcohol dehydrogenase family)